MKSVIVVVLFLIFYGCYLLFTQLLFGDNNLIEIKGQLHRKKNFVQLERVDEQTIEYAYLTFALQNDKRLYELKVAINNVYQGFNVFGGVNKSLQNAGQIAVWIKKSDLIKPKPKIYKIDADGTPIFEIKEKPGNNGQLYLMISMLCLLFLTIYYSFKNIERIALIFKRSANT